MTRSRGGFDESTPTQGSATAPTCGEPTQPPSYPLPLRGLSPPPLHSAPPSLPSRHLSFGPSNSRFSSLFAHNFSLNYYKTINKITKAHHLAWHQQVFHPAQPTHLRSIGRVSLPLLSTRGLRLTPSGFGKPAPRRAAHPETCDRDKEPGGASMNLRPPTAQQRLPPAASQRNRRRTRSGAYPRARYTPPLPTYHPAPLLLPIRTIPKKKFCPIFGVNLRILPILRP